MSGKTDLDKVQDQTPARKSVNPTVIKLKMNTCSADPPTELGPKQPIKKTGSALNIKLKADLGKAITPLRKWGIDSLSICLGNELAKRVEEAIFDRLNQQLQRQCQAHYCDSLYPNYIRYLFTDLNPDLDSGLAQALISSEMSISELIYYLFDDPMKLNPKFWAKATHQEDRIKEQLLDPLRGATITTLVKCGRCRSNKIHYSQLQTRSGDEGMTNFYRCLTCNHSWRVFN
jgi:DNA-directed RNA polymerase subunit M/transcription elongation factor TFIIS